MPSTIQACHDKVIELDNVHFSYGHKHVLRGIQYDVLQRDFVGLIGPNGAGKSTLLRMIVGLLQPESGEVRLFGESIRKFKDWQRIGYVPQRNAINAFFPASVKEVVLSGLYGRNKLFRRITKHEVRKCEEAMLALGIENLADNLIGKLSGGQQQRVLLARALVNNPDLLILDEPTVGIDADTQKDFFHMIRHMHRHHNITFLMVSHDLDMMFSYLGDVPNYSHGDIRFYVKHSHDLDDCRETDLTHSLHGLRMQMEDLVLEKA